jgi:GNAT superfamily N-acetyltransferase
LRFVEIHPNDELAQPLIAELAVEYATRYDGTEAGVLRWLRGYPAEEFSPPDGGMLIGLLDSVPVTGGAFRRFGVVDGTETAELKRIWTDSRYRRRGYGRILLAELEARIASLGYRRVYLTTGDRQPEAATPPPHRERACRHTDTPQAPCTIRTLTRPERSADEHQSG